MVQLVRIVGNLEIRIITLFFFLGFSLFFILSYQDILIFNVVKVVTRLNM